MQDNTQDFGRPLTRQPALLASLPEPVPVSAHAGDGQAQWEKDMEAKRRFLLLASYCGDDNPACSKYRPCNDCLSMGNVFRLEDGEIVFDRQLGERKLTRQPGKRK